jgi:hypothetical protein
LAELKKKALPFDDGTRGSRFQRLLPLPTYFNESLLDSVKQPEQIVAILKEPFEQDTLVEVVEGNRIYQELKKIECED